MSSYSQQFPTYAPGEKKTLDELVELFSQEPHFDFEDYWSGSCVMHDNTTFDSSNIPQEHREAHFDEKLYRQALVRHYLTPYQGR